MRRRLTLSAIIAATVLLGATAACAQKADIGFETIAQGLDSPVFVTAPAGDQRLFIVEQTGRIRILADGQVRPEPFLDVSDTIGSAGNEQGLLGLAFDPDFAGNGRFYVNYTGQGGDTQVVSYSSDGDVADPKSAKVLLSVDQPFPNHNGGWIGFGPDGLLYVGMGDGGSAGDPGDRAQNPDSLLGKILRIDVNSGDAPEIFASGVRNPWRMTFDDDNLYVADVGQVSREEISVISAGAPGANLGWNVMEGPECYEASSCDKSGLVEPILSYGHDSGRCSITGGFVYRGAAMPQLAGHYFFSDYCDGRIRSITYANGQVTAETDWTDRLGVAGNVTSFGLDSAGELYVMNTEGQLLKLVPGS